MATHLVFSREMYKHGYNISEVLAEALKAEDWPKIAKLKEFLPYCFVQLRAKEIEIKSETPEASKLAADQKFEAAKEFANLNKPNEQSS